MVAHAQYYTFVTILSASDADIAPSDLTDPFGAT